MITEDILLNKSIKKIEESTNYWFVRSNGGEYFERFLSGNFIAIEWDDIADLETIADQDFESLKDEVQSLYPKEERPGLIAKYLSQFILEMKIGDIIMVPSKNSEFLIFGKITSDPYIYSPSLEDKIAEIEDQLAPLYKRRNVEWFAKPRKRKYLDPYLVGIIHAHNTIVDANPYKDLINRSLYGLYYSGGKLHATFDVRRKGNVSAFELYEFLGTIFETAKIVSEIIDEDFSPEEISIKSAINSPGPVEIITGAMAFALVLSSISTFLNGSKAKFKLNIFQIFEVEHEIETEGALKKLSEYNEKRSARRLLEIESKLLRSKERLDISISNVDKTPQDE